MKSADFISFPKLVEVMRQLAVSRSNGTFFLGTQKNSFAQFAYRDGRICFVTYAGRRGRQALELIAKEKGVRYNFNPDVRSASEDSLPGEEDIYSILIGRKAIPEVQVARPVSDTRLTLGHIDLITDVLTRYIGPAAGIICEDHCKGHKTVQQVLNSLSSELESPADAELFRNEVLSRLN